MSSGAHWARKVPGWGPAVPSALRPLQLRSSSGHCVRKLAKSGKAEVNMEVEAEVVEENEEEEKNNSDKI